MLPRPPLVPPQSHQKVFISYGHDSPEHRDKVLALSERLRADGIETLLDQYVNGSSLRGWPRWMLDQPDAADFVLVVCAETYSRRFCGREVPRKGVDWDGLKRGGGSSVHAQGREGFLTPMPGSGPERSPKCPGSSTRVRALRICT